MRKVTYRDWIQFLLLEGVLECFSRFFDFVLRSSSPFFSVFIKLWRLYVESPQVCTSAYVEVSRLYTSAYVEVSRLYTSAYVESPQVCTRG